MSDEFIFRIPPVCVCLSLCYYHVVLFRRRNTKGGASTSASHSQSVSLASDKQLYINPEQRDRVREKDEKVLVHRGREII